MTLGPGLLLAACLSVQDAPKGKPWIDMDYGPYLTASIRVAKDNLATKGIAVRLPGNRFMLFDTDTLRVAAGWSGKFIDWKSIVFDGSHQTHPSIAGDLVFSNPWGPGWANPATGSFDDPRLEGRDKQRYGPLPREWGRWKGLYLHGDQVVLSYSVGGTDVLELMGVDGAALTRTLEVGPRSRPLLLQAGSGSAAPGLVGSVDKNWIATEDGPWRLKIPEGPAPLRFMIVYGGPADRLPAGPPELAPLTRGGPPRWGAKLALRPEVLGSADAPYVIESITLPGDNPWKSWMRPGGFDFFNDARRAALCTWSGDVWTVQGLDGDRLTWQRIAAGLFQPLGLRIVDETIYVCCRDQIARLHDLNGDGEIDFVESFNHDHQVTEHFHEFAMDLQTDAEGNFYYAKSARHALDSLVPHHGTLIKVSRDGSKSEIVCNGFRAANGVGIGPAGELVTSDQEGHWMPANRINLLKPGGFYGNMFSYHRGERPATYDPPLVWLPKNVDRSPAEQLWVASDRWGPFSGKLISLSYGTGQIFHVMKEADVVQGAAVAFPLLFPTGIMRGRFHPVDGQLYACGLFGWSSNRTQPGGFYRVRYTGKAFPFPLSHRVLADGVEISFTEPLDRATAEDPESWAVQRWNYRWTANYGSDHYRVSDPSKKGQDPVDIEKAALLADGRTVRLKLAVVEPVMQMEVAYRLKTAAGAAFQHRIYSTVNKVPER